MTHLVCAATRRLLLEMAVCCVSRQQGQETDSIKACSRRAACFYPQIIVRLHHNNGNGNWLPASILPHAKVPASGSTSALL
ncbi:hypothetical protein NDU88_002848 [Pleurodeles waltl]|uniref:Secreted protein n=1 Tax=Pleurodeles waltl TaxID=8319 RepID=A0AAV7LDL5_PLEWA|nr:hypothetical protein NDU88_002848 [Pleurodeles waltl]